MVSQVGEWQLQCYESLRTLLVLHLFVQGNQSQEVQPAGHAHRVSDELGQAGNIRLPT